MASPTSSSAADRLRISTNWSKTGKPTAARRFGRNTRSQSPVVLEGARSCGLPPSTLMGVMSEAVIAAYVRTPIGRYGGALASVRPDTLAAAAIRALLERTGVDPADVDDVILGCA